MKMNSKTTIDKTTTSLSTSDPVSDAHKKFLTTDSGRAVSSVADESVNMRGQVASHVVEKKDRALVAGGGTSHKLWNPVHPEIDKDRLWPSAILMDRIELQDAEYRSSTQTAEELRSRGDKVETFPFAHYRQNTYTGQIRQLDNQDCLKGKEPIYGTLENFNAVRLMAKQFMTRIVNTCEGSSALYDKCEMEDAPKLCMQQWKQPGWYLDSPITDATVPPLGNRQLQVIKRVCSAYKQRLPRDFDTNDFRSLCLQDYDPDDTMTGSPTYASGAQTHEARIDVLASAPVPDCPPEEWYSKLLALQAEIGWPDPCMYSPVLSTRFGPRVKPMRLWHGSDGYMESTKEAVGAYNRVRFVYPAPYLLNYLWSATYEQLSNVRKNYLGLWHDPESQDDYIAALQKQGGNPYSVDFSGMDTGMFPSIILAIIDGLINAGFCKWPLEMMKTIYPHMGIIFPTLEGGIENVSVVTGPARPWCSGFKLTSEFDTIYGLCVILDSLDTQVPGLLDKWATGQFVIAELGDDILFTMPSKINVDQLSEYALTTWGAKLKVNEDIMFLKWMLPLIPEIPSKAKTFARIVQQTLYNEDRYSGVQGGDRPPAVLRLALKARMMGLEHNPHYKEWMPDWLAILKRLEYVKTAPSKYIESVLLGSELCLPQDQIEIYNYAKSQPSYYLDLAERSKYEPSAAFLKSLWDNLRISTDATPALEIRKIYDEALFSVPTAEDVHRLMKWTNHAIQ